MTAPDKIELSLSELSLDGISLEPLATDAPASSAADGRASFKVDTRSGKERRVLADRRQELRFKPDRRSGKDRRPRRSWEPGSNL